MTFDKVDKDNNGSISRAEWDAMNLEFERERLADENNRRDAQRRMTWFGLFGLLLYPLGVILASALGLSQAAEIIGSMASIYFVSIAAIVGSFFGFSAMETKATSGKSSAQAEYKE